VFEQTANFNRADGLSVDRERPVGAGRAAGEFDAANDDMALGAVEALKARELVGQVAVIGFDALVEALLSIQNGELTATVEQFPGAEHALRCRSWSTSCVTARQRHRATTSSRRSSSRRTGVEQAERIGEIAGSKETDRRADRRRRPDPHRVLGAGSAVPLLRAHGTPDPR
jgi:hypothetical protein